MNPYLKKYSPGGKVIVDGKEISTSSNEYRNLYNSGNLLPVWDGLPTVYSNEEAVVTAKLTDEEKRNIKKKREQDAMYNTLQSGLNAGLQDGFDNQGNYISVPDKNGGIDVAMGSALFEGLPELTGIPSIIRVLKDPMGHFNSALRTMDDISTFGTMPNNTYTKEGDVSKTLDVVGAAGTVLPVASALGKMPALGKIPGIINKVPKVNPNVAASIAENITAPPRTINTIDDIQEFTGNATNVVSNLDDVSRRTIQEYGDHLLRQAAPQNVDIDDYSYFLQENLNNPQVLNAFADKMENMRRMFPFLDPNVSMSAAEMRTAIDNARRAMSGSPTTHWGLNANNQYAQMMDDWANQQRVIIRRMPSSNTQNTVNLGQYNQNIPSQIQQTSFQLPNIQNSGSFNVQDFIKSLKPKSFVERAKKTIDDINIKLGKTFFPVKNFDENSFLDEINTQLQKGMGIKKDDYKINVTKGYGGYDVHVLFPGETQPRHIGGIQLRKSRNAQQKTFTEGLLKDPDKNASFEKPNDFPYQNEPQLKKQNTGIGAEVHKAMSDALKKQGAGLTSSMYHLPDGNIRYIHEAIKKRGAIPLEGFTQAHFDELDDLRKKIGIDGRKIDTENYINSLPSAERNRILDLFQRVRWKIPKVAGIGTTGAAATYGAGQLIKEMKEKKESYKHGGSVKAYTKWVNNNSK
jgi:hypothetical protein